MHRLTLFWMLLSISGVVFGEPKQVDWDKFLSSKVNINFQKTTLERAFLMISQKTGITFTYDPGLVSGRRVDIRLRNVTIQDMLHRLLDPYGLTFVPKAGRELGIVSASRRSKIKGMVKDKQTGGPIPFANVFLEGTNLGSATDDKGYYEIKNVSPGRYSLKVQMIGFEGQSAIIHTEGREPLHLDFRLKPIALQMKEVVKVAAREKRIYTPEISEFRFKAEQFSLIPAHGEKDVYRALQLIPGVIVTSEFKSQLYVRGGNSDQNLVLLDGGIVYNPFHFSGILSAFDVDAIDNIAFSAGGFRAEYGGRLSSIIDIKSRKGADKYTALANISPLSYKVLAEGPIGEAGNFLCTARRSYMSKAANIMGGSVQPEFYDGIGRLDLKPTEDTRISLSSFYGKDKVVLQKAEDDQVMENQNLSVALNYKRIFSEKFYGSIQSNYGEFISEIPSYFYLEQTKKNKLNDIGLGSKLEYLMNDDIQFQAGVNYHHTHVTYQSFDPILAKLMINKRLNELACFIQSQLHVRKRWLIECGLRIYKFDLEMPLTVKPRLSLRYDIYNFLAIKAASGRFSQNMVTIYNENDTYNPVDIWLPPESYMHPATADHFIIGVDYHTPSLVMSIEMYWKNYQHLTHYNRERLHPDEPFFIQGKGYALGLDGSMQWIIQNWQLWFSYSLARSIKELPLKYPQPGIYKFPPRYDRRHNMNLAIEYVPKRNLNCSLRFSLSSGMPFSYMIGAYERWSSWFFYKPSDYPAHHPFESPYYFTAIKGDLNVFRFPWYHRLDISIKYIFTKSSFKFKPYFQIINLYDHQNVLYYDEFGKPYFSMPFLPMLGLEVTYSYN